MTIKPTTDSPEGNSMLAPCPFCGSSKIAHCLSKPNEQSGWMIEVVCQDCGVRQPSCDTESEAIETWNTRAAPQPTASPIGGLDREALEKLIQRHASAYVARGGGISDSIIAECKASRGALLTILALPAGGGREAREKEITRLATIEVCAQLIESGAGMADLIDQDDLDQQAKYIRDLALPLPEPAAMEVK